MEKKQTLPESIGRLAAARPLVELARALEESGVATASGLWGSSGSSAIAAIRKELKRPILLICGHLDEADDMADDIELFLGVRPNIMPAVELAGSLGRMSEEQVSNRLRMIARFAAQDFSPGLLVTPIQALMQSVPSSNQFGQLMRTIKPGLKLE